MSNLNFNSYQRLEKQPRNDGGIVSISTHDSLEHKLLPQSPYQAITMRYKGYRPLILRRLDGRYTTYYPDEMSSVDPISRDHAAKLLIFAADMQGPIVTSLNTIATEHRTITYDGLRLAQGPVYLPEFGIVLYYPEFEEEVLMTPFGGSAMKYYEQGGLWPLATKDSMLTAVLHTDDRSISEYYLSVDNGTLMRVTIKPALGHKSYLKVLCRSKSGAFIDSTETELPELDECKVTTTADGITFTHGFRADVVQRQVDTDRDELRRVKVELEQARRELEQTKKQVSELGRENTLLKSEVTNTKKELDNALDPSRRSYEQSILVQKERLMDKEAELSAYKQLAAKEQIKSDFVIQQMKVEKERLNTHSTNANTIATVIKTAAITAPIIIGGITAAYKFLTRPKKQADMFDTMDAIGYVSDIATSVVGSVRGICGTVKDFAGRVVDRVSEFCSDCWDGIRNVFS